MVNPYQSLHQILLCTLWTRFLSSFDMDRLRIFQIVNQSTSFLMNNSTFISFLSSHFTTSIQEKLGHSFNILLRNFFSQISIFIVFKFYLPQNTRKQFSQGLWHFITKIAFRPVSNNMFLISIWYFIRMIFTVRISTNICLWPLRFSLRRQTISLQHSPFPEPFGKLLLMPINNKAGFF